MFMSTNKDQQTFSMEDQMVNVFGFAALSPPSEGLSTATAMTPEATQNGSGGQGATPYPKGNLIQNNVYSIFFFSVTPQVNVAFLEDSGNLHRLK